MSNAMKPSLPAKRFINRPEVVANATFPDYLEMRQQAVEDRSFWDARPKEVIDWYEPHDGVF
jgi:hypothetical protein